MTGTLTFLQRGRTKQPPPPTPLRQIYSKMCVCLHRPSLSGPAAAIAKEVSRRGDNFSGCGAMGDPRPAEGGGESSAQPES